MNRCKSLVRWGIYLLVWALLIGAMLYIYMRTNL